MKRRRVVAAAGACVALIAGVMWFMSAVGSESIEDVVVSLRVNGGIETAIERGEPLLCEVFLSGRTDQTRFSIGSASAPWPRFVALRTENNVQLPSTLVVSAPTRTTLASDTAGPPGLDEGDGSIARIEGTRHVVTATIGLAPEAASSLGVGRHRLRAVLAVRTRKPWGRTTEASSLPVTIAVSEPVAANDARRLERTARFHIRTARYHEARQGADALIARHPENAAGHILLGDALRGLGDGRNALTAYSAGLEKIRAGRRFYDEPELLFERITNTEREVAAARHR